jgi:hypothetical protein
VPLSPATVALLRSVKASQAVERVKAASIWVETDLVFTTERGTAVDSRNAPRAINTAAKALGMSGVGLYTLRHSFATHIFAAGVPLQPSRSYSGTSPSRSPALRTATSPPWARASPSSGSQQQWAAENVCRCYTNGYTAAKRPPRISPKRPLTCYFPSG